MTSITIVRHGTTIWMEEGRLHGRLDSPLSPRGRQEAQLAAERLKSETFDALYSSPQGRALETARIIASAVGLDPIIATELREADFGWLEGRRVQMPSRMGPGRPLDRARGLAVAGLLTLSMVLSGESWRQMDRRVLELLLRLLGKHPDARLLLVAHSGVHSAIVRLTLGVPTALRGQHQAPCGITTVELDPRGRARLIRLNDTTHLGG